MCTPTEGVQWHRSSSLTATMVETTIAAAASPVAERLMSLLRHLGIPRTHVAAGFAPNAVALAKSYPESVASMTLVCPMQLLPEPGLSQSIPMLVFHGSNQATTTQILSGFQQATAFPLFDYEGAPWSDAMAEREHDLWPVMLTFLANESERCGLQSVALAEGRGEVSGVTYQVRGSGPPLLLLPLSLARSQWEPFIAELSTRYTTIVARGAHLGVVPHLEDRMQGGYRGVVRSAVDAAQPRPGESVLEVGCGPGAVARWLAQYLPADNPITAVDVNDYLLGEAALLTDAEGLAGRVTFQKGDAESLPFQSDSFDVTLSFTVMEEVDADRMLSELIRVTRPGGRIGVVIRSTDLPRFLNVSLSPELRSKVLVNSPPYVVGGVGPGGCADASLYRRFVDAGLHELLMGPQLASDDPRRSLQRMRVYVDRIERVLTAPEARELAEAIEAARADQTLIYGEPYHVAVGVKRS